jgi:hypothetical protein
VRAGAGGLAANRGCAGQMTSQAEMASTALETLTEDDVGIDVVAAYMLKPGRPFAVARRLVAEFVSRRGTIA